MEYANASMSIGGKIKRSDVGKLAEAIYEDGAGFDWMTADEDEILDGIEDAAKHKTHLTINNTEQPWGRFERVEGVCLTLRLTYVAECEAGGDWSPLLQFWQPAMGFKKQKTLDGEQDVPAMREWAIAEI